MYGTILYRCFDVPFILGFYFYISTHSASKKNTVTYVYVMWQIYILHFNKYRRHKNSQKTTGILTLEWNNSRNIHSQSDIPM
jgi:hypothetical protein